MYQVPQLPLAGIGILTKVKIKRENYYLNDGLYNLIGTAFHSDQNEINLPTDPIEMINSVEIDDKYL